MATERFTVVITQYSQWAVTDRRHKGWLKCCQSEKEANDLCHALNLVEGVFPGMIIASVPF